LAEQDSSCFGDPESDIEIDRAIIAPTTADECPRPGHVLNGEADPQRAGWRFSELRAGNTSTFATGELGGPNGTSAVRLDRKAQAMGRTWASTRLSVPLPSVGESGPALRFWWQGTDRQLVHVELGTFIPGRSDRGLDDLRGDGSDKQYTYCLPPWTHGNVVDLGFELLLLGGAANREFRVTDVEILNDPACQDSVELLDPGFESAPYQIAGVAHATVDQAARLVSGRSRRGNGALEFEYGNLAAAWWYDTWFLVPESFTGGGPRLAFYSDIPAGSDIPVGLVMGRAAQALPPFELLRGGGWRRNELCLPPTWSGRWVRVKLEVGQVPPTGTVDDLVSPAERMYFDDFEVGLSEACFANTQECEPESECVREDFCATPGACAPNETCWLGICR
jgi:hypothetical protein